MDEDSLSYDIVHTYMPMGKRCNKNCPFAKNLRYNRGEFSGLIIRINPIFVGQIQYIDQNMVFVRLNSRKKSENEFAFAIDDIFYDTA